MAVAHSRELNSAKHLENLEAVVQRLREIQELADFYRIDGSQRLDQKLRGHLGQFLTPRPVASRLAALFKPSNFEEIAVLDAGAGTGSLTAAAVVHLFSVGERPRRLRLVAYEISEIFRPFLEDVLQRICDVVETVGVSASYEVRSDDFIRSAVARLRGDLFSTRETFTHAILNPPFRKLSTDSEERLLLSNVGIECSNLYAAFVWLAARLLPSGGQVAAITPRSFCNGPYFLPFREGLLRTVALDEFVLVEERNLAFAEDEVLQETILFHGTRGAKQPKSVRIEKAMGADLSEALVEDIPFEDFVLPGDPQKFFHLVPDRHQADIKREMESLPTSLDQLGMSISTGRVVDFRAREHLRKEPEPGAVALIYPVHLTEGSITWPVTSKKPNAIARNSETEALLVPVGCYVLLRRFTSKEEKRRVVATVFEPTSAMAGQKAVGFENHLNYFHARGEPLDRRIAFGLAAFLNSSALDEYFRQFNGHTQVNATDLRQIKYPSREQLLSLGDRVSYASQQPAIDAAVVEVLNFMPASKLALEASRRIEEALRVLKDLDVPREQQNERSALVLLTAAGIRPEIPWGKATNPMLGITKMMDFISDAYGKKYAANTRETIRRFTVHQFVQIGLFNLNPDATRAPNSPKNVYQLEESALVLLRTFGTKGWSAALEVFKKASVKLAALREVERTMNLVPVTLPDGNVVEITAGGQNELIQAVVRDFCSRYTPGGVVLYLGDAGDKFVVNRLDELEKLGVLLDKHGKMPDLIVHFREKNWLVLVEAVTSHGPMNLKRKNELRALFGKSSAGLVFVTAFPTRAAMVKHLRDISWETEVWVAEAPTHLIHFNGERFLGPYEPN
jgi:adenine-specific DNA-methyltransferase